MTTRTFSPPKTIRPPPPVASFSRMRRRKRRRDYRGHLQLIHPPTSLALSTSLWKRTHIRLYHTFSLAKKLGKLCRVEYGEMLRCYTVPQVSSSPDGIFTFSPVAHFVEYPWRTDNTFFKYRRVHWRISVCVGRQVGVFWRLCATGECEMAISEVARIERPILPKKRPGLCPVGCTSIVKKGNGSVGREGSLILVPPSLPIRSCQIVFSSPAPTPFFSPSLGERPKTYV